MVRLPNTVDSQGRQGCSDAQARLLYAAHGDHHQQPYCGGRLATLLLLGRTAANPPGSLTLFHVVSIHPSERWVWGSGTEGISDAAQFLESLSGGSGVARRLDAGEMLFTTGDPVRSLFVIERGQLRLLRHTAHGATLILHVAPDGRGVRRGLAVLTDLSL
jgi:hypothetical protein